MKTLLLFLLVLFFASCEKENTDPAKAELVKCGTMRINSDGGPFKYQIGTSRSIYFSYATTDTTFDIYENSLYRIYYKGTTIQYLDSVFFLAGGPQDDSVFIRIDTIYDYHILERQTGTGSQSFNEILPSTIYDR